MPVRIYGAGMAGLLTAAMLRRLRPVIHEAQAVLPDNHGALLRFRTSAVQDATGQPLKRVNVLKAVKSGGRLRPVATIRDANLYSYKVTGELMARSVLDLSPCVRYIAPPDFISGMARDAILKMTASLTLDQLKENNAEGHTTISTIPMPVLMKMVGWETPGFAWRPIWSVTLAVKYPTLDLYQTIYYPEPDVPFYRASITGNKIIVEYAQDAGSTETPLLQDVLHDFGIPLDTADLTISAPKRQEYGKLLPLADATRQEFILAMTDQFNCYSVGRFATWRQILLDDVVQDVKRVEQWIVQRSAYHRRLELANARH